jgi:FtsX-like permease family
MAAIWLTVRAEWRQRWRSFVVLALLAGLAGGVTLAAFTGSRRADTAFARLEERVNTANLVVGAGHAGLDPEVVREAASWPGVDVAVHQASLHVSVADTGIQAGHNSVALAFPVVAGDDPVDPFLIVEGRRYNERRADELVVNEAMRDAVGAEIGDRLSLVSLTPEQFDVVRRTEDFPSPAGPTQQVRLVGVARTAEDVSDAPAPVLIVTPAYYERHGRAIAADHTLGLRVDEDRTPEIEDRVRSRFGEDVWIAARIEDGLAVDVNGLRAFAVAAALAGLVALGLAFVRQADAMSEQHHHRRALGMTSHQLMASGVAAGLPVALGGALVAAAGAVVGGPFAITGLARQAEPGHGPWLDAALLPGVVAVGLVVLVIAAAASWLAVVRGPTDEPLVPVRPSRGARFLAGLPPPVAVGVRMALHTGRGPTALPSGPALAGAAVGVAGVIAALTFGSRVDHLLATPKLWGADYDAIVTTVEDAPAEETAERVARDPDVTAVALVDWSQLSVPAGREQLPIEAVTVRGYQGVIRPVLVDGRAPGAPDEVTLGGEVLHRLGADVGDTVEAGEGVRLRVVGQYLQPAEDSANSGMLLTPEGFEAVAESDQSRVLVRFAPDADTVAALERLRNMGEQVEVTAAVHDAPSNIDNLDELGALPAALAVFLALLATISAVHVLVSTTRRRRRDLAVLRVLGFGSGQLRGTLRWQALTVAAVGSVIGVPAGVIAGRRIWSALASSVGVVDDWSFPWLTVALVVPLALGVAVVLAIPPGRAAARLSPGRVLRAE